jgi:hypothetical protein
MAEHLVKPLEQSCYIGKRKKAFEIACLAAEYEQSLLIAEQYYR